MQLANRVSRLGSSPIREILHVIDQPDMISFAGGLPAASSFPDVELNQINHLQLQYGATEGEFALREKIAADLANTGIDVAPEQVLILSGSQQGIDLVAKLMISEGTQVAVESPTYLAALQVFELFGACYTLYNKDDLDALTASAVQNPGCPALTYTIPTFQNPTGACYTLEQRKALASVCDENGSVLFEDDPYRELVYDDCERRPVCSFVKRCSWIYQSSFSKTLAPGLRLGYLVSSPDLFPYLCKLKQAADLHSNRLSQHIVLSLLQDSRSRQRMQSLVDTYRYKRDRFADLLDRHLSSQADWQVPMGGLFFWLKLKTDKAVDTRALLVESIKNDLAFMPGEPFFADDHQTQSYIRLNFSHATEQQSETGIRKLSRLLAGVVD